MKCIYIDPPYNTGENDLSYKDSYFHSSWLAMLYDRLNTMRDFQSPDGTLIVSIDDAELPRLLNLLEQVCGANDALAT